MYFYVFFAVGRFYARFLKCFFNESVINMFLMFFYLQINVFNIYVWNVYVV